LPPSERETYLKNISEKFGLPCIDPVAVGSGPIAQYMADNFK